jgi:hypothetical protein
MARYCVGASMEIDWGEVELPRSGGHMNA